MQYVITFLEGIITFISPCQPKVTRAIGFVIGFIVIFLVMGVLAGTLMLLAYSLGLGVPFILSAVLVDRLKSAFDWIKRNYGIINQICSGFLIIVGVLMATGTIG